MENSTKGGAGVPPSHENNLVFKVKKNMLQMVQNMGNFPECDFWSDLAL